MKKVMTIQVGADGIVTLTVPLAKAEANKTARIAVETVDDVTDSTTPITNRDDWLRFIEQTAGSITDPTFVRPPQGEFEERDPWP